MVAAEPAHDPTSRRLWRCVAVLLGVLIAYRLAGAIPLAGLAPELIPGAGTAWPTGIDRFSLGTLGVTPIVTAVLVGELVRLVVANARGARGDLGPAGWPASAAVFLLALTIAAIQAYGLSRAYEAFAAGGQALVPEPGAEFRLTCVVALVGATALFWWLAELLRREGLGGVWLLFVVTTLVELPAVLANAAEIARTFGPAAPSLLVPAAFLVATVAILATLYLALPAGDGGGALIWPAALGMTAANMLLPLVFALIPSEGTSQTAIQLLWAILAAALICLFVLAHNRAAASPLPSGLPRFVMLALAGITLIHALLSHLYGPDLLWPPLQAVVLPVVMIKLVDAGRRAMAAP